jgi:hypothetical protein
MAINIAPAPTSGVGVAAYIQLTDANSAPYKLVPLKTVATNYPSPAVYTLTLSLANQATDVITPALSDVANTSVSATAANWVYQSYNNPAITETTFSSVSPSISYTAKVASVSASGASTLTVTGLAKGQAIIEVDYPTFSNSSGNLNVSLGVPPASNLLSVPKDRIYVQIIVTVTT